MALIAIAYIEIHDKILPTQYVDKLRLSPEDAERFYNASFLSYSDIENYLNDATFLLPSKYGNTVVYFGSENRFISWFSIDINKGYWTADWKLMRRVFHDRSKWVVVRMFCKRYPYDPALDRCEVAQDLSSLFYSYELPKRIPGNPLNLHDDKPAPFQLPNKGPLSVDELQQEILKHTQ